MVFFCGLNQQETPAAADIQKRHAFLQIQLLQNVIHLIYLRLVQGVVLTAEISAGIAQCFIQPQLVEIISQIIMAGDLLLLILLGGRGMDKLLQRMLIR